VIKTIATFGSLASEGLAAAVIAELIAASYTDGNHAVSAWAFVVVAIAGYAVPRFIEGYDIPPRRAYALTAAIGLLLIYLLVRITVIGDVAIWELGWIGDFLRKAQETAERGGHSIVGGMMLLAMWARSSWRASDDIEIEMIPRAITLPFVVVTLFVVLGAATDRSGEIGRAGAAFYAVAIITLACSQLALSGATYGELRAGSTAGVLLGVAAGVAVVGLIIVGIVLEFVVPIVGPPLEAVTAWVLTIVLTPFAWVLTRLFEWLFAGENPFAGLSQAVADRSQEAAQGPKEEPGTAKRTGLFLMRTLALALMLAISLLAITLFVRLRRRGEARQDPAMEAYGSGQFTDDFRGMLKGLFRRKKYSDPGTASTEATRLYLEVLEKASATGHPRPSGETAREFAPVLHDTFESDVTDDITRAFESARYAGREPDARTIEELRRRWQQEAR